MKRIFGITALIVVAVLLAACGGGDNVITPEEAKARMDSGDPIVIVDVRFKKNTKRNILKEPSTSPSKDS